MTFIQIRAMMGALGLGALLASTFAVPLAGCDSDDCEEGAFQCSGQILQQCNSGAFETVEDCTGKGTCRADHGHCHPDGSGGGHEGGHHAGGMHMGGSHMGGMHEGGMHMGGMNMGGAGGAGGAGGG